MAFKEKKKLKSYKGFPASASGYLTHRDTFVGSFPRFFFLFFGGLSFSLAWSGFRIPVELVDSRSVHTASKKIKKY